MHTEGTLAPDSPEAARDAYDAYGPAARTVVREVTRRMDFDREEYEERVTGDVVATARDALFASLLSVTVGTREEFEAWYAEHDDLDLDRHGSETVDHVAWHVVPFAERVVATTFQNEEAAAVATLRRICFGSQYREVVE
ncbi:DUF5809 family protein [Halomarina ordinaria]|uniref:DUF5809 family protein n=1 Tax=Halomarina ordinaria TaxID=3033939 RepID=A0ABD5U8Q2_9EURY|nr:DUF5809 family protein [Halomarina sp. PSRA2]